MAKRYSAQRALELILEEKEGFDDDVDGEDSEQEVSEFEDHVSENSESDSDSEEGDEIEEQPFPKRRRATGPSRQQPAPGPSRQQPAPSRQQPVPGPGREQSDSQHGASEEIWMSKNSEIEWHSRPRKEPPRKAANVIRMQPGPTRMAVTHTQDIKSSFELFIPDSIQKIILDCTNLEGKRVLGERWKEMDQTHLHAYFGLLILAGVFRSKGESAESLWDTETFPCHNVSGNVSYNFKDYPLRQSR